MALERTGAADELCVSSFPQDCRRGNCLTCTGRIKEGTASSANLVRGEDGLAPHVSNDLARKGYVLTCSSFVVGEGLKVELGQNADVWEDTYRKRYENADSEKVGMHAQAKLLRLVAEGDVPKWTKDTEETLERS
jgi:ferredoxin